MLLGRSRYLAEVIARVIINIDYKLHELKEEAELKIIGKIRKGKRMHMLIEREGMPQGLNLSPLLSTLVLELLKAPKGLIMYADDGLFLAETDEDLLKFQKWTQKIDFFGAKIAPEKSGLVKDTFKFLGVEFSLKEKWMKCEDEILN